MEHGAMIDFIQIYLEEKSKNLTRPSRKNKDKNTIKVERHFGSKMTISCRVPLGNQQGLPHHAMQHVLSYPLRRQRFYDRFSINLLRTRFELNEHINSIVF